MKYHGRHSAVLWPAALMAAFLSVPALAETGSRARTAAALRFVGRPIATLTHASSGRGRSTVVFDVFLRLNHSIPRTADQTLGFATLDGIGGGGGLGLSVLRKQRAHPCYNERIDNSTASSPTLRKHRVGASVRVQLEITGGPPGYRVVQTLSTTVSLQPERHPNDQLYYPRLLGCLKN